MEWRSLKRTYPTLLISVVIAISPAAFAAPPAGAKGAKPRKSLDEALLEDLDSGMRRPPAGSEQPSKRVESSDDEGHSPASKEAKKRSLDDELLDGLEGEDVSLGKNPAQENPLMRLNERMKQVERRIAETHSDEKTQRLQQDISDDLSKLIAQLEQQCRQCKKPSSSSSQPQKTSQSKPASQPGEQPGDKPVRDSSARTRQRETAKVNSAQLQEMLKDVWGHLPLHLRQQMEQSANEEFLPKYETEISEYYKSLVGGRRERK